jgi:hypothetical protein
MTKARMQNIKHLINESALYFFTRLVLPTLANTQIIRNKGTFASATGAQRSNNALASRSLGQTLYEEY